jgi:glycosyltransferase involved in cell wall biosynthesis
MAAATECPDRAYGDTAMKVLYITLHLSLVGGAEVSLLDLVTALNSRGITTVIAYYGQDSHDAIAAFRGAGAELYAVAARPRARRIWQLRRIIERAKPDLVHAFHDRSSVGGSVAAWGTGARVLTSVIAIRHESPRTRPFTLATIRRTRRRFLERWTVRHLTDHVHAVSTAAKAADVARLGIAPDRVSVVVRGRDPGRLGHPGPDRRRRSRTTLGLHEDAQVIVNVGRVSPSKGWPDLLEAFDLLADSRPRAVLLVAGQPDAATPTFQTLRLGSSFANRIHLLGQRDDVPDILAAADVFAVPSLSEGFPGATIEAMALALPVVASDLPALREVVQDGATGILVPPRDPVRLASAFRELLDDPDSAQALGTRGREVFLDRFTVDRIGMEMIALYDRVITGARRTREERDAGG